MDLVSRTHGANPFGVYLRAWPMVLVLDGWVDRKGEEKHVATSWGGLSRAGKQNLGGKRAEKKGA